VAVIVPQPSRTLVLNASLEPLCVVSLRRAVTLVLSGKARVVESDGRVLRSEHTVVPLPLVLSLTRYVHVPRRRPSTPTRRGVLQRDAHRCAYCRGVADTVDHVVPRSRGGRHVWTNVVAACLRCNGRKADRMLHEIGWQLDFTPRAPLGAAAFVVPGYETAWSPYLAA